MIYTGENHRNEETISGGDYKDISKQDWNVVENGLLKVYIYPQKQGITNLAKVENANIKSIMFIPPASPAVKLTLGIVTLNGMMKVCSSRRSGNEKKDRGNTNG